MRTGFVIGVLASCLAAASAPAQSDISLADLQHHRWLLESINGEPLPEITNTGTVPEVDFGEQAYVEGNLGCNRFQGKAVVRDGFFLIESITATRKTCAPAWNAIELKVLTLLGSESTATISEAGVLALENADTKLLFRPADWVAGTARVVVRSGA